MSVLANVWTRKAQRSCSAGRRNRCGRISLGRVLRSYEVTTIAATSPANPGASPIRCSLPKSPTSSLRHTKIALAGKALDKLIDTSRKPVPDELLDEQDKLENEGITEMEDIGKFVMQMVMQWKK